uniref:Uncharacterized protein n=1 Tax=Angiostrongylus cantonensis TaxID=6313 RepID=A0A158P6L5_ANGCA
MDDDRKRSLISINQKRHSQVAKAAVLSSAMLTRKNSSGRVVGTTFPGRESIAAISDLLSTQQKNALKQDYVESERVELALKVACTISLITVCLHTPRTFELCWPLGYLVCFMDMVSVLLLTLEVVLTIHREGTNMVSEKLIDAQPMDAIRSVYVRLALDVVDSAPLPNSSSQFLTNFSSIRDTDPNNVTIADLAIPDTMCSHKGGGGYECPGEMASF